jgi:hypothetical protein
MKEAEDIFYKELKTEEDIKARLQRDREIMKILDSFNFRV